MPRKRKEQKPVDEQPPKNTPVQEFRAGRVRAAVWLNCQDNNAWFSTTFQRTYKDAEGHYRNTASFGIADMLPLAEIARQAWAWCVANQVLLGTAAPATEADGQDVPEVAF